MRIKKLLNNLFILSPFLIIIYFLFCINLIFKDFNYAHKSHNLSPAPINWVAYHFDYFKNYLSNLFLNDTKNLMGLKRIDIFIPEKTSKSLLENTPTSTKKYLKSKLLVNNKIQDVRLRYLGDNSLNWYFEQKSMRIKTKKKETINRKRYFEYKISQQMPLKEYIEFKLAKKLEMLVTDVRLVEVYVNEKSKGIYIEKSRLNESFLRRNKIMPVNMYKGEQFRNDENKIGLEINLFRNKGLWDKLSIFNLKEYEDKSDLNFLLNNIRKADNSSNYLNKILDNGNINLLSKKSTFEIFLQSSIASSDHNQRLVIDNWSGKFYTIPHDTIFNPHLLSGEDLILETVSSDSDLDRAIVQSSYFLNENYKTLFNYLVKKKIVKEVIDELKQIKKEYLISEKRDIGIIQRAYFQGEPIYNNYEENYDSVIKSLEKREEELIKLFYKKPKASWQNNNEGFSIKVNQRLPLSNLIVDFKNAKPKWVAIDSNNNLILDKNDTYFYPNENNIFLIDVTLFSNRIPTLDSSKSYKSYAINIANTKFKFFVNNNAKPSKVYARNKFSKKEFRIEENFSKSLHPSTNNFPIVKKINNKIKIYEGDIFVGSDLIIKDEVKIKKGTTFYLSEGSSVIFNNKVHAEGDMNNPIIFKEFEKDKKWGTIAIHGSKSRGSIFKNIIIDGGTGDTVNGINYFASLSIHSTEDIDFKNVVIKNNHEYDDMVHIIYSKNLSFQELRLLNSYRDAIDIDISKDIYFKNSKIYNSGNDGFDLMESTVTLDNIFISNAADKGISVGEMSKLNLYNSTIENSNYGLASKDSSKVNIYNSLFKDNKIQLSTYKKNWRYEESGSIEMKTSKISSKTNNLIIGDKNGSIKILSTDIVGKLKKKGNVAFVN